MAKMDYREKVQRLVEPRVFSYENANRDFDYAPVNFGLFTHETLKISDSQIPTMDWLQFIMSSITGVIDEVVRYKRQKMSGNQRGLSL